MYQLSYLQCSNSTIEVIRMTTNITTHAFCDLQPNTCYAIRVIAVNEKGPGEITSLNFTSTANSTSQVMLCSMSTSYTASTTPDSTTATSSISISEYESSITVTHTSDTHSSEYSTSSRTLSFVSSLSEHVIETNIKTQGV